ncbi:hypothetical protein E4T50_11980 [Aureobasidium sp. EXF-12298]|nr:hypothetical protein E4T50_11980 [Aureobasidium sp. EXF-12298]
MRISTIKQRGGCGTVRRRRSKPSSFPTKSTNPPTITPHFSEDSSSDNMVIECSTGIAQIKVTNGTNIGWHTYDCSRTSDKINSVVLELDEFDRSIPLAVGVLGCNGQITRVPCIWRIVHRAPIRISNSNIILNKQSTLASDPEEGHRWTVMLNERGPNGKLSRAEKIDLRVGAVLDGAVVYYEDGHKTPCGYRYNLDGSRFDMGGGNAQMLNLPQGIDIVKVEVKMHGWGRHCLGGITMTLSDGTKAGVLNRYNHVDDIKVMEPGPGERIVGFHGISGFYTHEFGIVTAPKDVELPVHTYDMRQLQNIQVKGQMSNL